MEKAQERCSFLKYSEIPHVFKVKKLKWGMVSNGMTRITECCVRWGGLTLGPHPPAWDRRGLQDSCHGSDSRCDITESLEGDVYQLDSLHPGADASGFLSLGESSLCVGQGVPVGVNPQLHLGWGACEGG